MDGDPDEDYQGAADFQFWSVCQRCPKAAATLERLRPYGSKALFQAAMTVALYQQLLYVMQRIPQEFDYYRLIDEFPQIYGVIDQAINSLLEDWLQTARG